MADLTGMLQASAGAGGEGTWDISTAVYGGATSNLQATVGVGRGCFFKPDGTIMYFMSTTTVYQFSLSTAWDLSTVSYVQNFSVLSQEGQARNVFIKDDGTEMYIVGPSSDSVHQYALSTPWDISTASFSQSFSVAAQETAPRGITFKPDGTKMYIVGSTGDKVTQYDLSTAWDISTASYVQVFSIIPQDRTPTGVAFKPDGTKMFVTGLDGLDVNAYDLSTAWDISTASYVQNLSVAEVGTPEGIFFRSDGRLMFVSGARSSNTISEVHYWTLD